MTKAIEHIVAGYSSLKDRRALEAIRDHRRRLLNDYRMRGESGLNFDWINVELQEEIGLVEDALSRLGDDQRSAS